MFQIIGVLLPVVYYVEETQLVEIIDYTSFLVLVYMNSVHRIFQDSLDVRALVR